MRSTSPRWEGHDRNGHLVRLKQRDRFGHHLRHIGDRRSITWSSLGLLNLAYGFVFAFAGYGAWLVAQYISPWGGVVLAGGILSGALGGIIICALAFIPIHDKPNFTMRGMIATLAISLIGTQALLWWFGPRVEEPAGDFRRLGKSRSSMVMTADKVGNRPDARSSC